MANAAIVRQNGTPIAASESRQLAKDFMESGLFPDLKSLSVAVVKIQAGKELGIEPFAAMRGIEIIQGRVTLNSGLMAGLIKKSGKYNYAVLERTAKRCELEFFEGGKSIGKASYTMEEANQAGLTGKATWKSYPADMLFSRALSRGFRTYCPDLGMGGVYTEGEIEEAPRVSVVEEKPSVDSETGEIIEPEKAARNEKKPDPIADAIKAMDRKQINSSITLRLSEVLEIDARGKNSDNLRSQAVCLLTDLAVDGVTGLDDRDAKLLLYKLNSTPKLMKQKYDKAIADLTSQLGEDAIEAEIADYPPANENEDDPFEATSEERQKEAVA